ncbi:unnamed protein product [Spodoptera littoralis]|uniref:Uncharacterized protein n=1 Tax=Spodoptera littoralis TaxID=7109 RepID=A0A9P0IBY9_SPOLI|nr:unnamed protein product [Spodoptera littoralis]CAH1643066.1 unnamed protein product [Spodoptera littoralis]
MQQLVRLLTDLVDYQVQQKTCSKLPNDLQNFLEWLTYPKEEALEPQPESLSYKPPYQDEDLMEPMQEMQTESGDDLFASVSNKKYEDDHDIDVKQMNRVNDMDVRAHYLDCLHSLQELMDQYDDMSDEDKSKMMGVKSYLDNQLKYLNKQMNGYELYSILEKQNMVRLKRDTDKKKKKRPKRRRLRRKLNKFIKNFGKKHTRTTASFYDAVQVTDMKRVTVKDDERVMATVDKNDKLAKRNLKDVYYKAVADAKKHATATKNVHKNSEVTHEPSTVKMQK